jgi:hypothetical protein
MMPPLVFNVDYEPAKPMGCTGVLRLWFAPVVGERCSSRCARRMAEGSCGVCGCSR